MEKTIYVKRAGHPDGRVRINEADFDPATETPWVDDTPADPAESDQTQAKPAKSGKAGKSGQ